MNEKTVRVTTRCLRLAVTLNNIGDPAGKIAIWLTRVSLVAIAAHF